MDDWLTWYVVATKPASEAMAARSISRLGFKAFAPIILVLPRYGTKPVLKPMFPHYLFVPFDVDRDPWTRIASAWGVSRILTTGAPDWRPLAMPAGAVEQLMNMRASDIPAENSKGFQRGDEVEVTAGPFAGHWGRIARLDSRGRCVLLLRILGGEIETRLQVARIAKRRPSRVA